MPVLLEIILLLLMSSDKMLRNLSLMHLIVSKVLPGEKLLTSHLTVLGLISTSLVPPCRVDLEFFGVVISFQTLHLMYNDARRVANTFNGNVPKSYARSFIDPSCIDNIS